MGAGRAVGPRRPLARRRRLQLDNPQRRSHERQLRRCLRHKRNGDDEPSGLERHAANPASAAAVTVGHTPLGSIVTDGAGLTVYLFEKDTGTTSSCYGACATAWPPVLATSTQPGAGNGANQAMLGTTMRTDGKTQLTYAGHPLYHFAGDHNPGDSTGQGSHAFGAGWYVITPAGQKIDSGD